MYTPQDHTFAVCAYGESPYLEECILSLKEQTLSTNILLATSTPNKLIQSLCEKYNIPMHINPGPGGIAGDWNFAVSVCTTPLVTMAHQDDLYKPSYAEHMLDTKYQALCRRDQAHPSKALKESEFFLAHRGSRMS